MKEYKVERLIHDGSSLQSIENSLNIAAMADWDLVCVSEGFAIYVRERQVNKSPLEPEKQK